MSQIIYGIHPVREALTSPSLRFQKILVSARNPSPSLQTILDLAQKRNVRLAFTDRETLDKMVKRGLHQNIIGIVEESLYATSKRFFPDQRKKE